MPVAPFYAETYRTALEERRAYYTIQRRRRLYSDRQQQRGARTSYIGTECFLSLTDGRRETRPGWIRQLDVKALCDKHGVKCSGLSAHCPVPQPDISVNYLRHAVRFAAEMGAPCVNTDEGVKADFTDVEPDHVLMKYTLTMVARAAEKRGILIGLELHQIYS